MKKYIPVFLPFLPGMVAAFLVAYAVYNTVFNNYYAIGATPWDTAQFATNIWRSGWEMRLPELYNGSSYFNYHISPILYLPLFYSYFFPGDYITYYALVYAFIYAVFFFIVSWHLGRCLRGKWAYVCGAAGALGLFLSAPVSNGSWEMRIDYLAIPFMLLALCAWQQKHYTKCLLFFMCTASVHEVMALIFVPLFVCLVASQLWLRRKEGAKAWWPQARRAIIIVVIPSLYSIAAFWFQLHFYHETDRLDQAYFSTHGNPYGHLNADIIKERLATIAHSQTGLWVPLLAGILFACFTRNMPLLAGFIGQAPYLLILLCAKAQLFATWSSYKSFPLALTLLWPSIIALPLAGMARKRLMAFQFILIACGCIQFVLTDSLVQVADQWTPQPFTYNADIYRSYGETELEKELTIPERVRISQGILSLYPTQLSSDKFTLRSIPPDVLLKADTLIWFEGDKDIHIIEWALANNQYFVTSVDNTKIRIAHKVGSSLMRVAP